MKSSVCIECAVVQVFRRILLKLNDSIGMVGASLIKNIRVLFVDLNRLIELDGNTDSQAGSRMAPRKAPARQGYYDEYVRCTTYRCPLPIDIMYEPCGRTSKVH